jgi:hypothetical protein
MLDLSKTLYTFMGESLIEFKLVENIDEYRIMGEDETNNYVFYKKHCYPSKEDAVYNMHKFLWNIDNKEV